MDDRPVGTQVSSPLLGRVSGVLETLRESATADGATDGLTEAECLEVITLLEATKGAAAALQASVTARFVEERDADARAARERGELSRRAASCRRSAARAEVALARRCSPAQADRQVRVAAALTSDLTHTMAALARGEINEWRASIIARETSALTPTDRAEADRRLAPDLTRLGDRALAAAAMRICVDLDQEAVVERRRRAAGSRCVSVRPAPDGMAHLSILGPLVDVVGAFAALKAAEQARFVASGDPEVDAARAADDRGRGPWMADTALERLSGRSAGQAQPVEVGLVMDESVVVPGADEGRVEVPGWGAIAPQVAREHVLALLDGEDAVWLRRLWTAPGGRDLVAMDSRRRLFTGGLRRLVELRDPTCRVPWCDAPTREVDHVVPFARGGSTSAGNAMGTCQRHNLVKEHPGWSAAVVATGLDPGGGAPHEVRLTTPTGSRFTCGAAPLLGPGRSEVRHVPPDRTAGWAGPTRPVGHARSPLEIFYDRCVAA